ncbi:ABC transporter permease [Kosmotoga arenicorallina S304]|uniref:ABC transporter permease n=1 Tax=Kosmotoga arenicorallina S304 TaxID=1453497 RepID=A0A182C7F4_9BACT|nr:carbohydrate ABC transporter permease [Kosmotoga arenicorallina]OAA31504.1 ABC transporter permease [Kosmotoga arenicorallina S304]
MMTISIAKKKKPQSLIVDIFIWFFLIGFAIIILAPLAFMFTASLMPSSDVMRLPYPWIPKSFYWQNFWQAIRGNDGSFIYIRNIINSVIVAVSITLSTVFLAALTGYGLAKFPFKGRNVVFLLIMTTMMIPFEAIMIPLYLIVTNFGWQDSYIGLIVPFLTNAFGVFLMRQYLITFPDEVIDAARIDGASEFSIFWRIIIPNSMPAIATLAILTFRSQWDNLLWPLLVVQSEEMKTIPLYIIKFSTEKYTNEGAMMAVAVIASLPMFVLFFTLSKYFLSGSSLFSSRKG